MRSDELSAGTKKIREELCKQSLSRSQYVRQCGQMIRNPLFEQGELILGHRRKTNADPRGTDTQRNYIHHSPIYTEKDRDSWQHELHRKLLINLNVMRTAKPQAFHAQVSDSTFDWPLPWDVCNDRNVSRTTRCLSALMEHTSI